MKLRRILLNLGAFFSLLSIAVAFTMWLMFSRGCGGNDEAVELALGLSQQRLSQIFHDVQALNSTEQTHLFIDTRTNVPPVFADLRLQSIVSDGQTARLHMSGCVDDKVLLIVNGIGKSGRREIALLPGETKDPVVLWQSK